MGGVVRLLVVRHGRTSWNAAGRYQGHADPPLDDVGIEQARAVAAALAPLSPALVVSSDLRRATATAAPLASAAGVPPRTDARLREVDLGTWEGLTQAEAADLHPDEQARWAAGEDIARGGGETRQAAGRRAADAIVEHLAVLDDNATAVVVSHGLVLRAALRRLCSSGLVTLAGDPPHLANGAWLDLEIPPVR